LAALSARLSSEHQTSAAVQAQQAAVDLLRGPVPADGQAARQQALAEALVNLTQQLIAAERLEDAAAPATEAIDAYRAVAQALRAGLRLQYKQVTGDQPDAVPVRWERPILHVTLDPGTGGRPE
jgi:hypothetical protein